MKKLKFIIIIILFTLNVILIFKVNLYSKTLSSVGNILKNTTTAISTFEKNTIEQNQNENLKLREDVKFISIKGSTVLAKEIFKTTTLVLRYSEFNCKDCIDAEINVILKNKDQFVDNICLIAYYMNKRDLFIFYKELQKRGLKNIKMYWLPNNGLNIPIEKTNMPYYFCINSELVISNVFIPQKDKPKLSNSYLRTVSKNFTNTKVIK